MLVKFIIRLPLAAATADFALPKTHEADEGGGAGLVPAHKVLVVDDLKPAADLLAMMLTRLGQEVRADYDGAAALGVIDEFRLEVMITDIGMSGMDGYELARRIRRIDNIRPVLVALTGYGYEEGPPAGVRGGFRSPPREASER